MIDYRIILIGTLSHHPLWNEAGQVRTPHSTTTLIRSGNRVLLVDPGLPGPALAARLFERAGLKPEQVTDVFLTNFRPAHRAGLSVLEHAKWWISEAERETVGQQLVAQHDRESADPQVQAVWKREIALLQRCKHAPDQLMPQVDLFPLPGYTPGNCGLLLVMPSVTVLIASDAVPTSEHLERGQVLSSAYDMQQAMDSLKEAVEIADWIIPGHDNMVPNMTRRAF